MALLVKGHPALPAWNFFDLDKGEKTDGVIAAIYTDDSYEIKVKDYPLNTTFYIYKNDKCMGDIPCLSLAMAGIESDILLEESKK